MTPHHMPSLRKLQESVLHLRMGANPRSKDPATEKAERKLHLPLQCGPVERPAHSGAAGQGCPGEMSLEREKNMDSNTNRCAYIENILDFHNGSRRSETQVPGKEVNK